jgi:ketosteroid isomerase-like protein
MSVDSNMDVIRKYLQAIEAFDGEGLRRFAEVGLVQIEHPNRLYANGQKRSLEEMARDLPRGAALLKRQSYPVETIFGSGDQVVVETRWEGELAVPLKELKAGDKMVAHICMVFTLRDGRIIRQVNYDCYEPF